MKSWQYIAALILALCLLPWGMPAQSTPTAACELAYPQLTSRDPNIFNDRQEQDLGDALAEYFESDMRIAPPAADDQLTRIGEKLLKTLPPTGIQYRFRVYDSAEINAFSLAGGRVYVSRKLIAAVKSEDELAGVLAHEIGHLSTHQTATEMTQMFKIRMGVSEVGDRADVFAKVHLFLSTPAKGGESDEQETRNELVADHVAIYALVRAGYNPASFPELFDRIVMNKGKTGNWLTDAFGMTQQNNLRYRDALKLVGILPQGCVSNPAPSSPAFQAWLENMVEERVKNGAETATGDKPVKLDPPLRPSPWRIRFSPDGATLLVQDEGSITVIKRDPAKVLFQITAPDAEAAQFTPDSSSIVFNDSNLRIEKWTVATGQRAWVKELVVYDGCTQTLLTPDGKTLACVKVDLDAMPPRIGLRLIDVDSGQPFLDKPRFFQVSTFATSFGLMEFVEEALSGVELVKLEVSPDARYFVAIAGQIHLAYDLFNRKTVDMGGKLKAVEGGPMTFIGPDRMFLSGGIKDNMREGLLVSFPEGKQLNEIGIGNQNFEGVTKGDGVVAWPFTDDAVGLVDIIKGQILAKTKLPALDQWNNFVVAEDPRGGLVIEEIGKQGAIYIPYPVGPLPSLRAAAFSPDGKYLAFSFHNRSAVWQLDTGTQIDMMRPFRTAWIDGQDRLWSQFPKYMGRDPEETISTLTTGSVKPLGKFDDADWQYRDMRLHFKPMGKDDSTRQHATLQMTKMETQAVAWSRDFPHETPRCWPADDDRMVLAWDLGTDAAKAEINTYPALQAQVQAMKKKDRGMLIETVNPETGVPGQQVLIPEADLTHGWDDVRRAMVSGNFVLVRGEHSNTVIYRIDTGAKVGEFFGTPLATDSTSGLIAAVNREDEILIVDKNSGKEINRFTLGSPARLAKIVPGKQKTLLVLTDDQVVHRVPLGE